MKDNQTTTPTTKGATMTLVAAGLDDGPKRKDGDLAMNVHEWSEEAFELEDVIYEDGEFYG